MMKTEPLYESLINQIKKLVIERGYSSEQRLPSERELSALFGVGRASIREALSALVMIGAIEVRYSEGIFIRNIHSIDLINQTRSLSRLMENNDKDTIHQAMDLMKILEIKVAGQVAKEASENDISRLKAILKKMGDALFNADDYVRIYSEFHKSLTAIGGNKFFEISINAVLSAASVFLKEMAMSFILSGHHACYTNLYDSHLNIIKALDDKNPIKAEEAVSKHFAVIDGFQKKFCSVPTQSRIEELVAEPQSLSFGVITFEDLQLTAKKFAGVIRALEESTGKKCNWFFPNSYTSLIEAHIRGFVHIAYYGPRSYLLAHERSNETIEAFAKAIWSTGPYRKKTLGYQSYLIVNAESAYQNLNDLEGKTLALTDPVSTSGDLIPKVQLGKKLRRKISEYFGKIFYAGSHDAAAMCVLEGRADCAVVADVTMDWAVDVKRYGPQDFRILWKSHLIPLNAFAWRKDLPPELREKIGTAFFGINQTEFGKEYLSAVRSNAIAVADDSDFDVIRKALNIVRKWE